MDYRKAGLRHESHHGRLVLCHEDRPASLYAMFAEALARNPGGPALVDGEARMTYADLADRIGRCAARLRILGLQRGDRLVVLLENRADYTVLLLASAWLGVIAVPANIRQRAPETAYMLNDCEAEAILFGKAHAQHLPSRAEAPGVRLWLAWEDEAEQWSAPGGTAPLLPPDNPPPGEDEPFCILYTSGTSGRPKGAVLTHLGVITSCLAAERHLRLGDGESMVLAVPAGHVTGVVLVLMLAIRIAGKVVIQREFKAAEFLATAARERMTYAIMVPAMYKLCLMDPGLAGHDLSAWRIGAYGGAPMPGAVAEELAQRCPGLVLVNIYGSTETSSPAVMMPLGEGGTRLDAIGRPLPHVSLVVVDDRGREVAPGEQGEIWIGGAMTVPRYWNNSAATEAGFVGAYWRSGDIGSIDAEGYVRVFDRVKDMINRGGFKIYSVEVENALMAHGDVVEAAVVGRHCPVLGERVEAFAVVRDATPGDVLRAFCAERLSDYKVPDYVHIVPGPLPRNANGKLLKTAIRGWLAEMPPG